MEFHSFNIDSRSSGVQARQGTIRVGEHGRHITNQYTKELSHKHTKTRGNQNQKKSIRRSKKYIL